jgi:hypothetical protein
MEKEEEKESLSSFILDKVFHCFETLCFDLLQSLLPNQLLNDAATFSDGGTLLALQCSMYFILRISIIFCSSHSLIVH